MKKVLLVLVLNLFFSMSVSAAEVHTVGFELTPFQERAIASELEGKLTGAEVEFSIKKVVTEYLSETFVRATILHEGKLITGMSFYREEDEFGSALWALKDALIE